MAADEYQDDYRSELEDEPESDGAQAMRRKESYVLEPELQQPTPRNVKVRTGTKVGRWILIAFVLGLPSVFSYFGNSSQATWEALKDHGVDIDGNLISTEPRKTGKNGHPPRGTYRYVVDRENFTVTTDLSDEEYQRARIGELRKIVYLPEEPGTAKTRDLLTAKEYSPQAVAMWVIASVTGLIFLVIWLFAERTRKRRTHLATEGIAVPTTMLTLTKASSKSNDNNWKVEYKFTHDGQTYDGKGTYGVKLVQHLMGYGSVATVLVDPYDPKRNELYLGVKKAMIVLPPEGNMAPFGAT